MVRLGRASCKTVVSGSIHLLLFYGILIAGTNESASRIRVGPAMAKRRPMTNALASDATAIQTHTILAPVAMNPVVSEMTILGICLMFFLLLSVF